MPDSVLSGLRRGGVPPRFYDLDNLIAIGELHTPGYSFLAYVSVRL
jgi:hypothetical protein